MVIRGLPIPTDVEQIKTELTKHKIKFNSLTQIYKGPRTNKILMPLFYVQCPKTPDNVEIYKIKEMLSMEIKIERYRGRNQATQCFSSQTWHHSSKTYYLPTKCVKCAGPPLI